MSGEVILIPWGTDQTVYDNTLTTEWILERGRQGTNAMHPTLLNAMPMFYFDCHRQAMGQKGQNYTIGNVYDWIGFVR